MFTHNPPDAGRDRRSDAAPHRAASGSVRETAQASGGRRDFGPNSSEITLFVDALRAASDRQLLEAAAAWSTSESTSYTRARTRVRAAYQSRLEWGRLASTFCLNATAGRKTSEWVDRFVCNAAALHFVTALVVKDLVDPEDVEVLARAWVRSGLYTSGRVADVDRDRWDSTGRLIGDSVLGPPGYCTPDPLPIAGNLGPNAAAVSLMLNDIAGCPLDQLRRAARAAEQRSRVEVDEAMRRVVGGLGPRHEAWWTARHRAHRALWERASGELGGSMVSKQLEDAVMDAAGAMAAEGAISPSDFTALIGPWQAAGSPTGWRRLARRSTQRPPTSA